MNYEYILKRSVSIFWHYKFLWVYGFVLVLCGQAGQNTPNFTSYLSLPNDSTKSITNSMAFKNLLPQPYGQVPIMIYILVGLLLVFVIGALVITGGALGRGALIKSVERLENGESIQFRQSLLDGKSKIIPLSLVQILLLSPVLAALLVVGTIEFVVNRNYFSQLFTYWLNPGSHGQSPVFTPIQPNSQLLFPLLCMVSCLYIIYEITSIYFTIFGFRAIVLENCGVLESISRSYAIFRQNMGTIIILAVLVLILFFVIGFLVTMPVSLIIFPMMMAAKSNLTNSGQNFPIYLFMNGFLIFLTLVYIFFFSCFQVFIETFWTLVYKELIKKGLPITADCVESKEE